MYTTCQPLAHFTEPSATNWDLSANKRRALPVPRVIENPMRIESTPLNNDEITTQRPSSNVGMNAQFSPEVRECLEDEITSDCDSERELIIVHAII